MTYEEAIKEISKMKEFAEKRGSYYGDNAIPTYTLAISALEKQIPKKPDLDGGIYCPCCLHEFKENYDTTSYCPNCGQAIDWSDTE